MNIKERELINNKRNLRNSRIISAILILLACFLFFRHIINGIYISKIENKEYDSTLENALFYPNIPQSYIPHYNLGNAAYEKEEYDNAIHEYQIALGLFPTHPDECNIRINLALSLLKKIDFEDLSSTSKVEDAVKILLSAREVLTEENCANREDDSGHNEEAEKLKKYIDELLKQLQQSSSSSNESEDNQEQDDSQSANNSLNSREEQIQQQLHNQMQDALSEQNQASQLYENAYSEFSNDSKNW